MNKDDYRRCRRCIMDTTVPRIVFNWQGECNFCQLHDKLSLEFPDGAEGAKELVHMAAEIKASGRGKKYDCVMGISGGRDSTFTLYYIKKKLGLRPLAVHFNDGFGNPRAGGNMMKVCRKLDVDLRTITSDWRESKDIRIAFLKASTPDIGEGTDVGLGAALYGVAARENLKYIVIGQSFRTEGIAPLSWSYFDGIYLKAVHQKFGRLPLRQWRPEDPGFNLGFKELAYYVIIRGIKIVTPLYYVSYVRHEVDDFLKNNFGWQDTGAHYFDDLYQSLITYVLRVKFNIDRRLYSYSALVRSGQMAREKAIAAVKQISRIEDQKIIHLCIKRLGMTEEEFNRFLKLPKKTFRDYSNSYQFFRLMRWPIRILSTLNFVPASTYDKYFHCGA